ncbi:hypothetical protein A0257_09220 [Hymenobacter psoromatis]|nr:hypothetical protein A0257_09220 [Hymenobacter psoromatis]
MMRPLAFFLTALVLLQSLGRELLVLNFAVNRAAIATKYCVNKTRPRLHCAGKCYLTRQLHRAENGPAKAPAGLLAKVKFEGVAPAPFRLALPAWAGLVAAPHFAPAVAHAYAAGPSRGIFRPPGERG